MVLSPQQKEEIYNYIDQGRKIEAIKYLTDTFNLRLRDAKRLVEEIEKERTGNVTYIKKGDNINKRVKGSDKTIKTVLIVFVLAGAIMTGFAIFFAMEVDKKVSEWVASNGTVTGLQGGSEGGSAPVITYEFENSVYNYQSSIYSNPPSYFVGEEVGIYINPEYPFEILINTFSEKWLLTMILGIMGVLFTGIPLIVYSAIKT